MRLKLHPLDYMARPPIPLRAGWATMSDTSRIWNYTDPRRRKRLNAIELIWDFGSMFTRTHLAELAGISRRQLLRWIVAFNEGGLDQLLYPPRRPLGRKRKISVDDFNNKVHPFLTDKNERGIPWSVVSLQNELAESFNIHASISAILRCLGRTGFRPSSSRQRTNIDLQWALPWPQEYGTCLEDYLTRTGQARRVSDKEGRRKSKQELVKEATPCEKSPESGLADDDDEILLTEPIPLRYP
jgi:transposase